MHQRLALVNCGEKPSMPPTTHTRMQFIAKTIKLRVLVNMRPLLIVYLVAFAAMASASTNSHSQAAQQKTDSFQGVPKVNFLELKTQHTHFQRSRASQKSKKHKFLAAVEAKVKDTAINKAVGLTKKYVPGSILPKRPDRAPWPKIPKELGRPPLPKVPSIEPKPVLQLGETVAQTEACVGCVFVWEKANGELDQSAGYEAVKDAFERTCAGTTPVFYDACDSMFENEDQMIQDYLANAKFTGMCQNVGLCSKDLPDGLPQTPTATESVGSKNTK